MATGLKFPNHTQIFHKKYSTKNTYHIKKNQNIYFQLINFLGQISELFGHRLKFCFNLKSITLILFSVQKKKEICHTFF